MSILDDTIELFARSKMKAANRALREKTIVNIETAQRGHLVVCTEMEQGVETVRMLNEALGLALEETR